MNTLEILVAARALIADPAHWTQHAAARNTLGNPVNALEQSACSWCASGAIFRAAGRFNNKGYEDAMKAIDSSFHVAYKNDTYTHTEVLALFDEAIARLGGSGK